jgi:dTMP kinase
MKIIAIEGIDKAGKNSQSVLLSQFLTYQGHNVVQSEFHNYSTPTGQLIQKWLYKQWDADQATIELIMAADKQAQQVWFASLEQQGVDYLVLDRYTTSQRVYAHCNGMDPMWVDALQKYMRQPDIEIMLDLPVEESMSRKGQHGENDRYESDKDLLERVRNQLLIEFNRANRFVIDALRPVDEIHRDIVSKLDLS